MATHLAVFRIQGPVVVVGLALAMSAGRRPAPSIERNRRRLF